MSTKQNILILYATWHGQAREVAERIANVALANGVEPRLHDVKKITREEFERPFDGVVVVGSVHFGVHPRVLQTFVRTDLARISSHRSAFVSVSGSAASLEGRDHADGYIQKFLRATGWKPDLVLACAGAVPFTKYDPFTRALMKFTSRTSGRGTDTSKDYVYTNWASVEAFAHEFLELIARSKAA